MQIQKFSYIGIRIDSPSPNQTPHHHDNFGNLPYEFKFLPYVMVWYKNILRQNKK